jgi:hypothetical protein
MSVPLTRTQALYYEVHSSWWAGWIGWSRAQDVAAKYFAWKVNRKMDRIKRRAGRIKRIIREEAIK